MDMNDVMRIPDGTLLEVLLSFICFIEFTYFI